MTKGQLVNTEDPSKTAFGLAAIWEKLPALREMSAKESMRQFWEHAVAALRMAPFTTLLTVLTNAVAFFLVTALTLVLSNVGDHIAARRSAVTVTFYLKDDVSDDDLAMLLADIRSSREVAKVTYQDKDQAFETFRRSLGESDVRLDGLESENPLPAYFEIRLQEEATSQELFERFVNRFSGNRAIENVHYSSALLARLTALLRAARVGGAIAILIMLGVCCFIVSNTIRLALYARRKEIEIMRLVGASERFIRTPFLIQGVMLATAGAAIAVVSGYIGFLAASLMLSSNPLLGPAFQSVHYLSIPTLFLFLSSAGAVGALASYLALRSLDDR